MELGQRHGQVQGDRAHPDPADRREDGEDLAPLAGGRTGRFDRGQGRGQVVAKVVDVEVLPRPARMASRIRATSGSPTASTAAGHEAAGPRGSPPGPRPRAVAIDQHDVRPHGRQAVLQPVVADHVLGLAGQAFAEQDPTRFVDPLDFAAGHDTPA